MSLTNILIALTKLGMCTDTFLFYIIKRAEVLPSSFMLHPSLSCPSWDIPMPSFPEQLRKPWERAACQRRGARDVSVSHRMLGASWDDEQTRKHFKIMGVRLLIVREGKYTHREREK